MGFGTVGSSVEEILYNKRKSLLKNNFAIEIDRILIKDKSKKRSPLNKDLIFTDNFKEILKSKDQSSEKEIREKLENLSNSYKVRALEIDKKGAFII